MGEKPVTYDEYMKVMEEIQKITSEENYDNLEKILKQATMAERKWKNDFKNLAEQAGVNVDAEGLDYLWGVLMHFYTVAAREGVPWMV